MSKQERTKAVLKASRIKKIPICEVVESICQPEFHDEIMDLCEESVIRRINSSLKITN